MNMTMNCGYCISDEMGCQEERIVMRKSMNVTN